MGGDIMRRNIGFILALLLIFSISILGGCESEEEKAYQESHKKFMGGENDIIIGDGEGF